MTMMKLLRIDDRLGVWVENNEIGVASRGDRALAPQPGEPRGRSGHPVSDPLEGQPPGDGTGPDRIEPYL